MYKMARRLPNYKILRNQLIFHLKLRKTPITIRSSKVSRERKKTQRCQRMS